MVSWKTKILQKHNDGEQVENVKTAPLLVLSLETYKDCMEQSGRSQNK